MVGTSRCTTANATRYAGRKFFRFAAIEGELSPKAVRVG
jgi:hypothetical protein